MAPAVLQPLQSFMTNPAGAAIVNAMGPIRQLVETDVKSQRRYLVIVPATGTTLGAPVQALRIFHNLSAMLCFAYVVWVIQRYIRQREELAKTVQQQRDDLLQDVELAAQVQRMFPRRPLQHLYRHRHRQ
jgi:hypothetical protein